jgi:hypothetical protein
MSGGSFSSVGTIGHGSAGIFGGGAGSSSVFGANDSGPVGGSGAVRIIWPGATRTFPSTDVGTP